MKINVLRTAGAGLYQELSKKAIGTPSTTIGVIILVLIIVIVFIGISNHNSLLKKNIDRINKYNRNNKVSITNFPLNKYAKGHALRDYYIKTAYNCCASGELKNDFVHTDALKGCIKQGVRCLDFQIQCVDDKPVITVSTRKNYNIKESNNIVIFEDALQIIKNYAFSPSESPNPEDPLILHFRILSGNTRILKKMAISLRDKLQDKLLGKDYAFQYIRQASNGKEKRQNIGAVALEKLKGKVIIIIDRKYADTYDSVLDEYVNLTSNDPRGFMQNISHKKTKDSDMEELIKYNKQKMTMSHPDLKRNLQNQNPIKAINTGCQFIAMAFQKVNSENFKFYNSMFNKEGSAFILKHENLRNINIILPGKKPPNEEHSYAPRVIEEDHFKIKI